MNLLFVRAILFCTPSSLFIRPNQKTVPFYRKKHRFRLVFNLDLAVYGICRNLRIVFVSCVVKVDLTLGISVYNGYEGRIGHLVFIRSISDVEAVNAARQRHIQSQRALGAAGGNICSSNAAVIKGSAASRNVLFGYGTLVDDGGKPAEGASLGGEGAAVFHIQIHSQIVIDNGGAVIGLFFTVIGRDDLNQIPYNYTLEVTNTFKGLDLTDRVPEELWMEVHDIIQEAEIKTIPKKKKCKKAKWLCEEALQTAMKRREAKGKGEKEKYIHLNAKFQRITRRDKKAFLSDQCKEIQENIGWERLQISSRKLEIPREHFMQRWAQ